MPDVNDSVPRGKCRKSWDGMPARAATALPLTSGDFCGDSCRTDSELELEAGRILHAVIPSAGPEALNHNLIII